ncbi:MAG: hypothetical protein EXS05_11405 [Planctomycetaceae bacterium]|nr:hypothetical protein [Planctomycetaceae bacterium]
MSRRILLLFGVIVIALVGVLDVLLRQRAPQNDPLPGGPLPNGAVVGETSAPPRAIAGADSKDSESDSSADPAISATVESGLSFQEWLHRADHHVDPPPLFKDWENPAAILVLSGEMHGYIEPCGCSLNQLGGLSRRADLFRQIRERGWPMAALDVGGLVNLPTKRQSKIKLRMALESLRELQYAGVALGVAELRTGLDLLQFTDDDRPSFLSCNLVLFGAPDLGCHIAKKTVIVGAVKIGITAVFGESFRTEVLPAGNAAGAQPPDVEILDPVESLTKTLAELETEEPDLLVLLSHSRLSESKEFAEKFPQLDLIVSAGGSEDPDPRPKYVGKTLVVPPGQKGKHVAAVGLFLQADQKETAQKKLRLEVIALDGQRFQDSPAMHDQMRRYQEALAVQDLVAGDPAVEDPRNAQLEENNGYVGAKVCGECHTKAYQFWLTTKHASATESIKTGRAEQKTSFINRINDPECVACHVTGWSPQDPFYRYKTGFESEEKSPHLVGQQCENCHGPGSRHTDLERQFQKDQQESDELIKFREFVQIFADEAAGKICVKCHDGDNDPLFKTDADIFAKYWDEVKHPWRD